VLQQTGVLSCTTTTTARFHTAKCELMIISGGVVSTNIKIQTKIGSCLAPRNITYAKDKRSEGNITNLKLKYI
jgi:hypothetical protein